jgi:hypothetical protein
MTTATSPTTVSDFLLRLSDDPELLVSQTHDPRATMASAGLSDEQIEAYLAGPARLRDSLDSELDRDPIRRRLVIRPRMTLHTPTPEPEPEPEPGPESGPERTPLSA